MSKLQNVPVLAQVSVHVLFNYCVVIYTEMPLFFYQSLEYWDLLQYPFTHKGTPGHIRDVQDGEIYKELSKCGEFLSQNLQP